MHTMPSDLRFQSHFLIRARVIGTKDARAEARRKERAAIACKETSYRVLQCR